MEHENIYLVKLNNENEEFYKIGLTVHRYCRFYQLMKYGYNLEIICMVMKLNCFEAFNAEEKLKDYFYKQHYIPKIWFGGYTECFATIDPTEFESELLKIITPKNYDIVRGVKITWR